MITRLIEDLATNLDEVRPIELQITGAQLQRENIHTLSQYRQIGKQPKEKLVREYLEDVVRNCGQENREIARLVLSLLITEQSNTRPLKTKQDLEAGLENLQIREKFEKSTLVLNIFVLSGLVVSLPEQPEDRYQLVHDYLVDVILQQIGTSAFLFTQLKEAANDILIKAKEITQNRRLRTHKIWILGIAAIVTVGILLLRWTGGLQKLEWMALDWLFHKRPSSSVENRILIVAIDEKDIQQNGTWPISDRTIAELIDKLNKAQPRAIGLDIYRDLPVEPGHDLLQETMTQIPNFIGIEKLEDKQGSKINPPVSLTEEAIGFNNVVTDADGKVRRSLFYWHEDGEPHTSFALRLALLYLQQEEIEAQPSEINPRYLKLGNITFPALQPNDGAYIRTDNRGYQVLVNFRRPDAFETVTLREVINNEVSPDRIRDRIIVIGSMAPSLGDFVYTPYSTNPFDSSISPVYGVKLHANFLSYILSAVLDKRPILRTWNEPIEWLWIFAWSGLGATLGWYWYFKHLKQMIISIAIALLSLVGVIYSMFLGGLWLPFIPPVLGLIFSVMVFPLVTARQLEKQELRYTIQLLVASVKEQPLAGQIALQHLKQSEKVENQNMIEKIMQQSEIDSENEFSNK